MSRRASTPAAFLLAAALTSPALVTPGAGAAERPVVTGFALGSLAPAVVHRDAGALATVTIAGIGLRRAGDGVGSPTDDMSRLRRAAAGDGLRTELLVNNWSNRDEAFDPVAAHRLLASGAHRRAVAARVARHADAGGWDGVNVDLELVRASDAAGLVAFVRVLQQALPPAATVSIDVSAATSSRAYAARGYDLDGLAEVADVIVVMTYDQHGPTWSGPGPVGGLDWQRAALRALLGAVPAQQVDLGVAGYGYTWPREATGRSVTVAQARAIVRRAGARPVWHPRLGEWSARLPNGTVLWWSDARSLRQRVRLAAERGLHGVALWRLGSADPLQSRAR